MTSPNLAQDDQEAVWQAEGILMELLSCESVEAALLLRWRALAEKRGVVETAAAVLSGMRWWPIVGT